MSTWILNHIQNWIATGGYLMLFGLLFICGLGLPLPEDIPLIIAGALVANGKMELITTCIAGWCGIIGGDCILYSMGRRFGLGITRVPIIGKHLTQSRIERVERLFEQYGTGVIFVGRMFAGVRAAMVVAAGAIRYNFITFIIADGLGAVVSGGFFLFVGHWLGQNLNEENIKRFRHLFLGGGLLLVLVLVGWILWRRRHRPVADDLVDRFVPRAGDGQASSNAAPGNGVDEPPVNPIPAQPHELPR
jgi:membrane protein DedA with SNARE-associated domain